LQAATHQSRRAEPASRVGMSQGFKSLRRTDNEIIVVPESGIRIEQVILNLRMQRWDANAS